MRRIIHICVLLSLLIGDALWFSACAPPLYYDRPKEWIVPGAMQGMIDQYRPFLTGRRIFLDPGHGGEDRYGRGPTEAAIEADVNLSVALELRSFLQDAGATVFLSRRSDSTVSLHDRPKLAVAAGAEIFVSLHHNDTGTRDNITNYSSVYYHSVPGRPDYQPANHDLARYIERDLAYAMRNPEPSYSPTFDGTLSDFDIYPNAGFAVLRENPLPAVLIEGSFFSHPREEQRLAIREFNRIEAWGIFLGLGKYFRAGVPDLALLSDTIQRTPHPVLKILAGPKDQIDSSSLAVWVDSLAARGTHLDSLGMISVEPPVDLTSGVHQLRVEIRNRQGNSSWPFIRQITAMLPIAGLSLTATPPLLPPDPRATTRISSRAFDDQGRRVADGSAVLFSIGSPGTDTLLRTLAGRATLDLHPAGERLSVRARGDGRADSIGVPVEPGKGWTYVCGTVRSSSDSTPVEGAAIRLPASGRDTGMSVLASSDFDGQFFAFQKLPDSITLHASAEGFFSRQTVVHADNAYATTSIQLTPVAEGLIFGDLLLLDPRFGGLETGDVRGTLRSSDLDLAVARRLQALLRAAGANAVLVRDRDTTISEHDRAQLSARYGRGFYLRIDASGRAGATSSEIHASTTNDRFAGSLLRWVRATTGLDSTSITGNESRFYREVAQATISIIIPSASTGYYDTGREARIDGLAWGMFLGILENAGYAGFHPQQFMVTDARSAAPISSAPVTADEVLCRMTDENGIVDFFGVLPEGATMRSPTDSVVQPVIRPR